MDEVVHQRDLRIRISRPSVPRDEEIGFDDGDTDNEVIRLTRSATVDVTYGIKK